MLAIHRVSAVPPVGARTRHYPASIPATRASDENTRSLPSACALSRPCTRATHALHTRCRCGRPSTRVGGRAVAASAHRAPPRAACCTPLCGCGALAHHTHAHPAATGQKRRRGCVARAVPHRMLAGVPARRHACPDGLTARLLAQHAPGPVCCTPVCAVGVARCVAFAAHRRRRCHADAAACTRVPLACAVAAAAAVKAAAAGGGVCVLTASSAAPQLKDADDARGCV